MGTGVQAEIESAFAFLPERERASLNVALADLIRAHGGDPRLPQGGAAFAATMIADWVRRYAQKVLARAALAVSPEPLGVRRVEGAPGELVIMQGARLCLRLDTAQAKQLANLLTLVAG